MAILNWENYNYMGPLRDIVNLLVNTVNGQGRQDLSGTPNAVNFPLPPIGVALPFFGSVAPNSSYALCQGQSLSRTAYPTLFGMVGTTHGSVDANSFNLPDLRGRTIFGYKVSETEFDVIGKTGGVKEVTLTANQSGLREHFQTVKTTQNAGGLLPPALHASGENGTENNTYLSDGVKNVDGVAGRNGAQNALDAHTNLPPYMVANWIMRVL